jgi:transcriptional regulator with XRE-family HTH domain
MGTTCWVTGQLFLALISLKDESANCALAPHEMTRHVQHHFISRQRSDLNFLAIRWDGIFRCVQQGHLMNKSKAGDVDIAEGSNFGDEQPLVRALVSEAKRRGDTMRDLAQTLGVTYTRLAQWRRRESDFANARPSVFELAAKYLGVPTVLALAMAGKVRVDDFVWPVGLPLNQRLEQELNRMRADPYIGGFVPNDMALASAGVQLFTLFLFHQVAGNGAGEGANWRWMRALHLAALGSQESRFDLQKMHQESGKDRLF